MKTTGMPFNADMVRALLREIAEPGTGKTQTRRLDGLRRINATPGVFALRSVGRNYDGCGHMASFTTGGGYANVVSPYGGPGDLIYVRETFADVPTNTGGELTGIAFAADEWDALGNEEGCVPRERVKFTPSIHMPRWASRITLEITRVRVERVQKIAEKDALAEGLWKRPHKTSHAYGYEGGWEAGHGSHSGAYGSLWNSIYAARGLGWDDNPWVWVYEFTPRLINVDDLLRERESA